MSNQKKKKLSPTQQQYQVFAQAREPKRPVLLNSARAFLVGGIISTIGQFFHWIFVTFFDFTDVSASNPTVAVLIIIAALLTGLGVYDHLAQWAGAGTIVPVTGFANTIASSAIEHRSEGFVLGVGGNMFKIAGPVITYGVFAAFVIAIIKLIFMELGAI
ncbi:stage V sporulation protein AC [Candidatus Contubernalis alkaliaceticus]|uniref:stage V sporulation protein AC n=1 Tax=Candidatus Contubernalis alkaliaceticus TaxID=338645 RepID=UPI001F4C2878|nr:stage V sporulation protein AC [Candidatus Contubernalis alkalaceticus]UNC93303.1 stage V sporulation protein AC [Candidatus Contubernalis alkalaceticus]